MEISSAWKIARPYEKQPSALGGSGLPVDPADDVGLLVEHEVVIFVRTGQSQLESQFGFVQLISLCRYAPWRPSSVSEAVPRGQGR